MILLGWSKNSLFLYNVNVHHCMRFKVLTAVKISVLVFWVVTPCGLVVRYQGSALKMIL
jgi:hypothetical protein